MKIKLKISGNGWELYLSKTIIKLLGYNPEQVKLIIKTRENTLFIEPIKEEDVELYSNNLIKGIHKSGGSFGLYLSNSLLSVMKVEPEKDFIDMEITDNKFTLKKWVEE